MNLKKPNNSKAEVLHTMIINGEVSIFDYPYMSGFRTRISELRLEYDFEFTSKKKSGINKHGNSYLYSVHILNDNEKEKAIKVYNQINK